ncbi:MAG: 4Fe-4S binding protein [Burkholderiaceae bacterium]|nr:4Fe-4S binding protein [Burkholderiaceae bacterium]
MHRTRLLSCTCNATVALADAGLESLDPRLGVQVSAPARELCRREIGRFVEAIEGAEPVLVTCTQEAALFAELASAKRSDAKVHFVNIRERAGWGEQRASAGPKIAALVAMAAVADPDPVPSVQYASRGRTLVIGAARDALDWAERFAGNLTVTALLISADGTALGAQRHFVTLSGRPTHLSGWLGAFDVGWEQINPIDLDACVRCGACVAACPEQAIAEDFQVDPDRCASHRACVTACGEIGAIDFTRAEKARTETFDLIFDLREAPAFSGPDLPHGYFHPARDERARTRDALLLASLVGEFEKPRYVAVNERTCAHQRNRIEGCRNCIDTCSTSAITASGDAVRIEAHRCLGCGGCATVCPSGAITHRYPGVPELARRLRIGLAAFRASGGANPVVLVHDAESGRRMLDEVGRGPLSGGQRGPARAEPGVRGLPARVVPFEVHHVGSVGIDLALAAIAYGASQVVVLAAGREAQSYLDALDAQFGYACAILAALGLGTQRFSKIVPRDAVELETALHALQPVRSIATAATFAASAEKRRTIDFALDHLAAHAGVTKSIASQHIVLERGAPFGSLNIDAARCTLCKACVGACPGSALQESSELPQLRFVERNCVQCGICVKTCPEQAITLVPRYTFSEEARTAKVLYEAQPFHCVACGKPFGTRQMVDSMVARFASHSMFGGKGVRRLQMCADCRVTDMFSAPDEMSIHEVPRRS